jgi:hypothetical protein
VKQTQKQKGDISDKVRKEVKERSGGVCEVQLKCTGAFGLQMAHVIGRKQIAHKTTANDILHSCVECHVYLDTTPDGIQWKKDWVKKWQKSNG